MRFMTMMDKEAPMFAGMYWAHDHMDMLMMMKQKMPHMNYIIGTMSSMMGWMSAGKFKRMIAFDVFSGRLILIRL